MFLPPDRFLVIPDVHQNIRWVEAALARELGAVDGVIFLGDYFDPKLSTAASADRVADFFAGLPDSLGKPVYFLVGNHDLPYLYDIQCQWQNLAPFENPYRCSGYMPERSRWIAKRWDRAFCSRLRGVVMANGHILSHAGVHRSHFDGLKPKEEPTVDQLDAIAKQVAEALTDLIGRIDPLLFAVATARGGFDAVGSVTWLDWYEEFKDNLPWPQIVGHTVQTKPDKKGRSWNIDTRGKHYGILTPKGFETRKIELG